MKYIHCTILTVVITLSPFQLACAANKDGAADLGVDYAFLTLMTLTPEFAAANYTIENPDNSEVGIVIGRLPYHVELRKTDNSLLELEIAVAHQETEELIQTFPGPDENIDAKWYTTGIGIGVLHQRQVADYLQFTASLRFGLVKMKNHAVYNGVLTNIIKDNFEGTLLNWETRASILNPGLGFRYQWKLLDRQSSVTAEYHHILVDSYSESNQAVSFSESANMLNIDADMIFPTGIYLHGQRLDLILLLGSNSFVGENRRTLGYTTSYQVGIGAEFPLKWSQQIVGHLRLSGHVLWAGNMNGWMLTVGYNPE